ncbi:hypothetical protein [Sabulicella glaciei]|uniref:Uncharacterized protein n=1 Tax=Sabulicella glaciei TaxID=2984948 RepID=A0ABT3NVZ8_9PROT|nr:hypothetical protein [Roseococcus sp. MDT2-1-1]MCW8086344.1 hypothetical protein [Roseococcus sp. MDT2-1-1]
MAFHLPIELDNTGVAASYWRITHVQLDRAAGVVEAVMHGFRDAEAREGGKAPLQRLGFRLELEAMDDPCTLALEDLYRAIRAIPAADGNAPIFADATDI